MLGREGGDEEGMKSQFDGNSLVGLISCSTLASILDVSPSWHQVAITVRSMSRKVGHRKLLLASPRPP